MLPWILYHDTRNKTAGNWYKTVAAVFVFLGLFFSLFGPVRVQGENTDVLGLKPVQDTIQLGNQDILVIAGKIIVVILGLLGIIVFGLMLYAGFLIMTAAGNEEKIIKGKKTMTNAIIGFVIIISSYAIVQFVFKSLIDAFGDGSAVAEDGESNKPYFAGFAGTGGLGSVIKDHYPLANQVGVARNTNIAVTFATAIKPSSLIKNTNNTCWPKDGSGKPALITPNLCELFTDGPDKGQPMPYYGDCTDLNNDKAISWETECDRVDTASVQLFFKSEATSTKKTLFEMAAIASYDADRKAYTFTFNPFELLGSDINDIWHTVKLIGGSSKTGIKKLDGSDIFPAQFISKFYVWNFETNTKIDLAPPHVVDTRPRVGNAMYRNSIIRIDFNEPMDPSVTQGLLTDSSSFTNIIFADPAVKGEWKISNGYRSLEFISADQCGQNSCGEPMYCLPAPGCDPSETACEAPYTALTRTAALANPAQDLFVAQPFTGITDMAGNALDNGPGNKPDGLLFEPADKSWRHKPPLREDDPKTIGGLEKNPDNYWWQFKVKNDIDRSIPYIARITPGLDAEGVKGNENVIIRFSKYMMYSSIPGGAGILEYPKNVIGGQDNAPLDDFGYHFSIFDDSDAEGTVAKILHPREFGPGGLDLYYFTFVSSSVKGDNQNCLYPGRGPNGEKNSSPVCYYEENPDGTIKKQTDCVPVTFSADTDTGCVFGLDDSKKLETNVVNCLKKIEDESPSEFD